VSFRELQQNSHIHLQKEKTAVPAKMNAQFQTLFENVCRCFGHAPDNSNAAGNPNGSGATAAPGVDTRHHGSTPIEQVNSTSSAGARRRTNRLELKDKKWDELFEKNQRGSSQQNRNGSSRQRNQPPRPEGYNGSSTTQGGKMSGVDHDNANALAQAKLAANPPRYRTKRKRSAQAREEIFRSKDERGGVGRNGTRSGTSGRNGYSTSTPQTDFSRLLNPSLALCFATPIRGTEEEPEEQDLRSVDNSDTATLNTNGEDTITSTLYFDSKYAHIQETRPPMPLFNQFKIGQAKDEIRTIMATDSHSSLRMIKLMQQQQQTRDEIMPGPEGEDSSSSDEGGKGKSGRPNRRSHGASPRKQDANGVCVDHDEEMQDAVPDVKAVSSSTDSSRLSNTAKRHAI